MLLVVWKLGFMIISKWFFQGHHDATKLCNECRRVVEAETSRDEKVVLVSRRISSLSR